MRRRIAVASSDGKIVNQHFGRCGKFIIIELDPLSKKYTVVELRGVEPACGQDGHTPEGLISVVKALSDCRYVVVSRIGPFAKTALKEKGIDSVEFTGLIEDLFNHFYSK